MYNAEQKRQNMPTNGGSFRRKHHSVVWPMFSDNSGRFFRSNLYSLYNLNDSLEIHVMLQLFVWSGFQYVIRRRPGISIVRQLTEYVVSSFFDSSGWLS